MRRTIAVVVAAASALSLSFAPAALAHVQTVAPPGKDAPVILNDPISKPWAQAHCHAEAPEAVAASGGVVSFPPGTSLPCPPVPNPGGQTTGP